MNIDTIIDEAYFLYMPQIRWEITELSKLVAEKIGYANQFDNSYRILEIGTKFGGSFHIWNSLNRYGLNVSIDMSDGGLHGGVSEEDMDKRDAMFKEKFDTCAFVRGNSHDIETVNMCINSCMNKYGGLGRFDFIFIDGDHTYEGVKADFMMYSSLLDSGGIIAFHDIVDSQRHRDRDVYVSKFWEELKASGKYETIEFVEPGNDWGGIGIVRFPQSN